MSDFDIKWFDGDHFYFKDRAEEVVEYLCGEASE